MKAEFHRFYSRLAAMVVVGVLNMIGVALIDLLSVFPRSCLMLLATCVWCETNMVNANLCCCVFWLGTIFNTHVRAIRG